MMMKVAPRFSSRWLWPAAALGLVGCPNEELAPIGPCTVAGVFDKITQNGADQVDVLFVVDNSPSMKEEQENLANNLPLLVEILASGEIKDGEGKVVQKFPPVKSLHLGVTTTNMGINGAPTRTANDGGIFVPKASCDGFGDDGLLLNKPDKSVAGCDRAFPKYLEYPSDMVSPEDLGASFGCVSRTGSEGCGFEQQLEAPLKALSPSSIAYFHKGSTGHGDVENAGFLREGSVIAVIMVSDEEDSSIPDTSVELFNALAGDKTRINIRQYEPVAPLHPTSRYVDGLKALRQSNPDLVIFAGIVGVPKGVEGLVIGEGDEEQQDFDAILKLKDMEFVPTPKTSGTSTTYYPNAVCVNASVTPASEAYPAPRMVEVAKGFGKNGVIRSICDENFSGALTAIIRKIANQLSGACLQRKLIADSTSGLAPCGLVEYLPIGATEANCVASEGRKFLEKRPDDNDKERIVCQLNQLAVKKTQPGCEAGETDAMQCLARNPNDPNAKENPRITDAIVGWYYDDFTKELLESKPGCNEQRIAFTPGAEQKKGSEIRFECLQPVFSVFAQPKGVDAVNKPCAGQEVVCKNASNGEYTLACNAQRSTCQIQCQEDSNCPDGWVCEQEGGAKVGICLNPTCPPQ